MPWTQSDLDTLKAAYASGVRRVTLPSGHTTEWADLAQMRQAIQDIQAELRASAGGRRLTPRHQLASFSGGD